MTSERTRRGVLALAAAVAGAGCTTLPDTGTRTPTADPDNPGGSPTPTDPASPSESSTPASDVFVLERADGVPEGSIRVFQPELASLLEAAATSDRSVRSVAPTIRPSPDPILPDFEYVRLRRPDDDLGTYAVDAEAGAYYEMLVGADRLEESEVPGDATVTPVSELPAERREFAREAVDGERGPKVSPQTRLGEWTRHEWFDGYFRVDGTVYRGKEVHQTDAAFFSERCWYVVSLSPDEAPNADAAEIRLPAPGATAREGLAQAVTTAVTDGTADVAAADLSEETASFLRGTDHLLTHTAVLRVRVV